VNLCEALRFALTGREDELPNTPDELLNYSEKSRAQLAREIEGLPPSGRLPRKGTDERRRYDTLSRRLQRWTTTRGAQRRSFREARSGWRETRRAFFRRRFPSWARMRRRGARMRLEARVKIPSPGKGGMDDRVRLMPAGGPGTFISADEISEVLRLLVDEDDCDAASEALLESFAESYGFLELVEGLEDNEVIGLKLWADGDPEP
jgi:hypothetical protein